MLLILDKGTKKINENKGTNSLFPDGNIPNLIPDEHEIFVRLHDDSEFAKQIMTAYDYELVLDENNEVINVIVHKTLEQFLSEQPIPEPQPTLEEQLAEKDKQIQLLKEQQLRTDADLSAFMDFVLMGGM